MVFQGIGGLIETKRKVILPAVEATAKLIDGVVKSPVAQGIQTASERILNVTGTAVQQAPLIVNAFGRVLDAKTKALGRVYSAGMCRMLCPITKKPETRVRCFQRHCDLADVVVDDNLEREYYDDEDVYAGQKS